MFNSIATLVSGATGPSLTLTFKRPTTGVVDLTGATVTATINRGNLPSLNKTLTVIAPATNGQAQLQWAAGDLVAATDQTYLVDFYITTVYGTEIQPQSASIIVRPAVN